MGAKTLEEIDEQKDWHRRATKKIYIHMGHVINNSFLPTDCFSTFRLLVRFVLIFHSLTISTSFPHSLGASSHSLNHRFCHTWQHGNALFSNKNNFPVVGRELKGPGLLEAGGGSRCGHPRNGNSGFGHSGGGAGRGSWADNTRL